MLKDCEEGSIAEFPSDGDDGVVVVVVVLLVLVTYV